MLLVSSVAFAADGDVDLDVNNPTAGHEYYYWQLFTGDLASDGTLSNVKWGADAAASISYPNPDFDNGQEEGPTNQKNISVTVTAGAAVPAGVLTYLESLSSQASTNDGQAVADIISGWLKGNGTKIEDNTKVAKGYYVIKDKYANASAATVSTLSTNIVAIVDHTTIQPKNGTTEHTKKVLDVNDTTDTKINLDGLKNITEGWDKTADHDIGDRVPFMLTTKIASDFAKYETYYLAVTDTLKDGLTMTETDQASIKVYVDDTLETEGTGDGQYKLTKSASGFKVEFPDIKKNAKAAANKEVVIVYTATLGETNVVIGNPGNVNESYAEYSNNPNDDQSGTPSTGKTPTDTSVVFTYKTDVDKVDPEGNDLTGAGFTLYKKYKAEETDKGVNVAGSTPAGAKSDTFPSNEFWYAVKTISTGTNFEFKGIDDGTYILVESTTPEGYNTMDPITLTVNATHGADENSTTKYSVSVLDDGRDDFASDAKGGTITFDRKKAADKILTTGEIYSEIVNESGATLPSTGGIGTTIFYVAGSIMVLAAAILLITKRRMGAND